MSTEKSEGVDREGSTASSRSSEGPALDDETEICIDNVLWDYRDYVDDAHEVTDAALNASRNALRQRIVDLIEEGRRAGAESIRQSLPEFTEGEDKSQSPASFRTPAKIKRLPTETQYIPYHELVLKVNELIDRANQSSRMPTLGEFLARSDSARGETV